MFTCSTPWITAQQSDPPVKRPSKENDQASHLPICGSSTVTEHQSARSIAKLLGRSPSTVSREMSRNGGYLTGPDLKHGDDPCSKPLAKLSRREPPSLTLPAGIELTPVSCGYVGADDILVSLKTKTGDVVSHTLKTAAMVHMVNLSVALINGFTAQVLRDLGAL
jgi:hypothetical protein